MPTEFFYGKNYTRRWSGDIPQVCIYFGGNIVLSPVAMNTFGLKIGMYFLLGYDKETRTITLRKACENAIGSRKLCMPGQIAAWSFLQFFEIKWRLPQCRTPKRYELKKVGDDYCFTLEQNE